MLAQAVQLGQQRQQQQLHRAQLARPPAPQRRASEKQAAPRQEQVALPQALELGDEATADNKRQVYLVTLPPPTQSHAASGEALVAPGSLTKAQVLAAFLDSCAHPVYVDCHSISAGYKVALELCGVWREFCTAPANANNPEHDHIPALASSSFRYLPVKRALLQRHGLASHWSCTHFGYRSCARYMAMSSPKKPLSG